MIKSASKAQMLKHLESRVSFFRVPELMFFETAYLMDSSTEAISQTSSGGVSIQSPQNLQNPPRQRIEPARRAKVVSYLVPDRTWSRASDWQEGAPATCPSWPDPSRMFPVRVFNENSAKAELLGIQVFLAVAPSSRGCGAARTN